MANMRLYNLLKQILSKINTLNKNKIEIVKLWENASPTSEFVAQSVTNSNFGNEDAYEFILIDEHNRNSFIIANRVDSRLLMSMSQYDASTWYRVSRPIAINSGKLGVQNCYLEQRTGSTFGTTTANNNLVPYRIYGIKGVL